MQRRMKSTGSPSIARNPVRNVMPGRRSSVSAHFRTPPRKSRARNRYSAIVKALKSQNRWRWGPIASGRPIRRPCFHQEDAVPLSEKLKRGGGSTMFPPMNADGSLMTRPPTATAFPSSLAFGPRVTSPKTATAFPLTVPLIVVEPITETEFPLTEPSTVRCPKTATAFPSTDSSCPTRVESPTETLLSSM